MSRQKVVETGWKERQTDETSLANLVEILYNLFGGFSRGFLNFTYH